MFNQFFHAITFPLDEERIGVMKQAVKDCRGNDVILKDLAPLLGRFVRGHDDRTFFITSGDDLEEERCSLF